MDEDAGLGERYALALDQARRNLDRQADDLREIRSRATTVLGVAGLAITLIGGLALRDDAELHRLSYAALAAFALVALLALAITYPQSFVFAYDANGMLWWIERDEADLGWMTRELTVHLQQSFWSNSTKLRLMTRLYSVAVLALVAEVVLLLLDLRGR